MTKQLVDGELDIKRKVRRRLVGSIALTLVVVATLPMVLDSEPKPNANDIELKIPDPEKVPPLKPLAEVPEATSASSVAAVPTADPAAAVNHAQMGQIKPVAPSLSQTVEPVKTPETPVVAPAVIPHDTAKTPEASKPVEPVKPREPAKPHESSKPVEQAKPVVVKPVVKEPKVEPKPVHVEHKITEPTKAVERKEPAKVEAKPVERKEVKAEVKPAEPKELVKETKPSAAEAYVVQIGAFGNPETARQEVVKLQGLGFRAYTEKVGNMVRVRVGPYHDKDKAEDAQGVLQHHGVSSSVMKAK